MLQLWDSPLLLLEKDTIAVTPVFPMAMLESLQLRLSELARVVERVSDRMRVQLVSNALQLTRPGIPNPGAMLQPVGREPAFNLEYAKLMELRCAHFLLLFVCVDIQSCDTLIR